MRRYIMSASITTLLTTLTPMIDQYSNTDTKWVTFIQDHLSYVISNSIIVTMTDSDRDKYKNMFVRYMRDKGCPVDMIWIAALLNGVDDYSDFTLLNALYIPTLSYINTLYRTYRTSNNLT